MTNSPNLGLPNIAGDQAQKHVTHNEALAILDGLVQLTVLSRTTFEPPVSPEAVDGDRYIVPPPDVSPGASGDFEGEEDTVAMLSDGAWMFLTPQVGWRAYVADEDAWVLWDGSEWVDAFSQSFLNSILGIEQGSWSPALTFQTPGDLNVVYSTQLGTYVKIGSLYICEYRLVTSTFTHTTASGNARIGGLPATVGTAFRNALTRWQGITKASYTQVGISPNAGNTFGIMSASGSAQAVSNVSATDMPSGGTVELGGTLMFTV